MKLLVLQMRIVGCLVYLVISSLLFADMPALDSSSFPNKYEGNLFPLLLDYTTIEGLGGVLSTDGDILNYTLPPSPNEITKFESNTWSSQVDCTTGYTIEFRAKITSADKPWGSFRVFASTNHAADNFFLWLTPERIRMYPWFDYIDTNRNDYAFHTFRIAREPTYQNYNCTLWCDGVELGVFPMLNTYALSTMHWLGGNGDCKGSGQIGYFRWTPGAYAPVPEPITIVIVGLGGLVGAIRKR